MIFAGNQPYFLPYIGYWQLLNVANVFALSDDYNYKIDGWIHRNRIINNGCPLYFGLIIKDKSANKKINELEIRNCNFEEKIKTIKHTYGKAPFFSNGNKIVNEIFSFKGTNLADFLYHSTTIICEYLDIKTKLITTSSLEGNALLKREHRIYDQCARLGADTYINAIGGMQLYDFEEFKKRGITLKFLKTRPIEYKQFNHPFVPNLSILDVIMFNSREEVIKMLDCYDLIGV